MNVLIVDDEQHVREGIKLLGEWDKYGIVNIYEAENGAEAIELIKSFKPSIIFSDMKMPKMDGIQLLEWIKEHHPYSKTIVVTGYDDYHYMRKAIHFGSMDYILKPIDPEILNHTLENAVTVWKKEEASRKKVDSSYQLINEMKPVYRDRKLTQLINNDRLNETLIKEFGLHMAQEYVIAIVRISGKSIRAFQGDRDLTYYTVLNVINEILTKKECGIGFRYLSNKGEIVIICWKNINESKELLRNIYHTLKEVLGISCPIALGKSVKKISDLMDSYHFAKQIMLSYNVLDPKAEKVYFHEIQSKIDLVNIMSFSSNIDLAVQAGEIGPFNEIIQEITKEFIANNFLSFKQLLHFEIEYQVISSRWLKKYEIPYNEIEDFEKQIDLFFNEHGVFQLEDYIERKKREIYVFLKKVKKRSSNKNLNIIYDIEKFLQANFDRDIKLQEIADRFYLSREYISRKFKQEFNENITDYIVKIRMNKAKSLLKNSQLKIYEIARIIGYQDDKYFRKVFKKVEGLTPNEYRASRS